jgi:hypothetical protein
VKSATSTRTEPLHKSERKDGTVKFSMTSITVDGVYTKRPPQRLYDNYMFVLKTELNDNDIAEDVGYPFHWHPNVEVSEKHWLKCDEIVYVGQRCHVCNEIGE